MQVRFDARGTPDALRAVLSALDAHPDVGTILFFAGEDNGYTPEGIDDILAEVQKPLLGGIFPQILHGHAHHTRGLVALGLPERAQVRVVPRLTEGSAAVEAAVAGAFPPLPSAAGGTMLLLVDGLSGHVGTVVEALFNQFGLELDYFGGGAGSMSFVQGPCVMSRSGLVADAAVLAWYPGRCGLGVAHGWRPVTEAFKVTEAEGPIVKSLDWRPAAHVYREVTEAHSGRRLDPDDFFALSKAYPFGIANLGAEMVVRDPLRLEGDHIVCIGEVPAGAFVYVLHGDHASLLDAASEARQRAEAAFAGQEVGAAVVIDCITRVLFLEGDFPQELARLGAGRAPTVGALTLGEIANSGQDYLEFYNKTVVVGLF